MVTAPDILLVEDDPQMREVMVDVLAEHGYECTTASNGNEALVHLERAQFAPRLILADLIMPDLDGWQLLRVLRSDARLGSIPVVICSSHRGAAKDVRAMGADEFIAKPLSIEQLLQVAARFVGAARSADHG